MTVIVRVLAVGVNFVACSVVQGSHVVSDFVCSGKPKSRGDNTEEREVGMRVDMPTNNGDSSRLVLNKRSKGGFFINLLKTIMSTE